MYVYMCLLKVKTDNIQKTDEGKISSKNRVTENIIAGNELKSSRFFSFISFKNDLFRYF